MRTLLFGAALVTACLFPVTPVAAQCCGGGAAQAGEHAAHAAPAPAQATHACCGDQQPMADKKAEKKEEKKAEKTPAACCGAQVLPADDPAIAIAALGLAKEFRFGGPPAAQGHPAVR